MKKFLGIILLFNISFTGFSEPHLDLTAWLKLEREVALQKMLKNINPPGSLPGIVIASPSKENPNYYFHWVRDAALSMESVYQLFLQSLSPSNSNGHSQKYLNLLLESFSLSAVLQNNFAFSGLSEPKYYVDGKSYKFPWGRPQHDGPAIRASLNTKLALWYLSQGHSQIVEEQFYSILNSKKALNVLKKDFDQVEKTWNEKGFDLWEEVYGKHFYTMAAQRKAMFDASDLAQKIYDFSASMRYLRTTQLIETQLVQFWDAEKKYFNSTREGGFRANSKPSNLDSSIILALLHFRLPDDAVLNTLDSKMLQTALALEKAFKKAYEINHEKAQGFAMGRYPEDHYFGGNPWYLISLGMSQFYFQLGIDLLHFCQSSQSACLMKVLELLALLNPELPSKQNLTKYNSAEVLEMFLGKLDGRAEAYLLNLQSLIPKDGSLSEQYDRKTGQPLSAQDLTWSYSAFLNMFEVRKIFKAQWASTKLIR